MDPRMKQRLGRIGLLTLRILAVVVMLSCSPNDPLGVERDARKTRRAAEEAQWDYLNTSNALAATQKAVATLEAEFHAAQTEEAAAAAPQIEAPAAAPLAPAAPAPPQAQTGHAPKILNVDIAREVPANGTKVGGTIIFEDAAQDVVLLRADVLSATLTAESWTYDPRQNMVWSGTRGIAAFQVWCTGDPQDVSYNYTLVDSAGNVSAPWQVSYACK